MTLFHLLLKEHLRILNS